MDVIVKRKEMLRALAIAGKARASRSALDILKMFALWADADGLRVAATNLELYLRQAVPAEVREWGSACVGSLLAEFLARTTGDEAHMKLDGTRLVVRCGRDTAKLPTMDMAEFPAWPSSTVAVARIPAGILSGVARRVLHAVSNDYSRPALCGVNVELGDGCLRMAGANGHCLAVASEMIDTDAAITMLLPPKIFDLISSEGDGDVVLSKADNVYADNQLLFSGSGWELLVRPMLDRFPEYRAVIPTGVSPIFVAGRADVIAACKQLRGLARLGVNAVRLEIKGGAVEMSTQATGYGVAATGIPADVLTDEPLSIALNVDYLTDALLSMDEDQVRLEMNAADGPVVLRPVGDVDHLCMIMPMNIRREQDEETG